jgi:aspartyl/asparaginyl-tRNA synthetase
MNKFIEKTIVKSRIKENGRIYNIGDEYGGENHTKLAHALDIVKVEIIEVPAKESDYEATNDKVIKGTFSEASSNIDKSINQGRRGRPKKDS